MNSSLRADRSEHVSNSGSTPDGALGGAAAALVAEAQVELLRLLARLVAQTWIAAHGPQHHDRLDDA